MSLNSLDLPGVRLLSPRDSQILPKQMQVPRIPVQVAQSSSSEFDEDLGRYYVSFPDDQ